MRIWLENYPNFKIHIKNRVKKWENWHFFEFSKCGIGVFGVASRVLGGGDATLSTMRLRLFFAISV